MKQESKPEMQVSIKLEIKFEQDKRTGNYIAYFDQFPQAVGAGRDENEAGSHLLDVFQVMVKEREYDIKQQIVEKYMGGIEFNNLRMPA